MDPLVNDSSLCPGMVMCGDHPSFTKKELNAKDPRYDLEKMSRDKLLSYSRLTTATSQLDKPVEPPAEPPTASEQGIRAEARRARDPGTQQLVQAAMGSFRWPPYLLGVWVVVLLLTHLLHSLVCVLERALPGLRRFCQYFRTWTEAAWKAEKELNQKVYPVGLAVVTCVLYTIYFGLYVVYSVAVWSIEPLCVLDVKSSASDMETKITNYVDDVVSKTNCNVK